MPISKKRKKKGKKVGNGLNKNNRAHQERLDDVDMSAGVSLQNLIDVVAFQEFQEDPDAYRAAHPVVDDKQEEPEDGRQGSSSAGAAVQRGEEERGES